MQYLNLLPTRIEIQVIPSIDGWVSEVDSAKFLSVVHFEHLNDTNFSATDVHGVAANGHIFDLNRELDAVRVHFPFRFTLGVHQDTGVVEVYLDLYEITFFHTIITTVAAAAHTTTVAAAAHTTTVAAAAHTTTVAAARTRAIVTGEIMIAVMPMTISMATTILAVIVFLHHVIEAFQMHYGDVFGHLVFRDPEVYGMAHLDFDPRGQKIEVLQGDTVILEVEFPVEQ